MKNILVLAGIYAMLSFTGSGSKERETFTVYGNCGMCEKTIENALTGVDGIDWADWEVETLQLTVKFDPDKITLNQIKERVADVGYDSETNRATEEAYESLHPCCKYERP